jgi:hypothetical protein
MAKSARPALCPKPGVDISLSNDPHSEAEALAVQQGNEPTVEALEGSYHLRQTHFRTTTHPPFQIQFSLSGGVYHFAPARPSQVIKFLERPLIDPI